MSKNKHLTLPERSIIQNMLNQSASFKCIARELNRDCTTISKEVRIRLLFQKTGCLGHAFNDCANRYDCPVTHLCVKPNCTTKFCRFCPQCHLHCQDYYKQYCDRLYAPPYVCNGCEKRKKCTLEKHVYSAVSAQKDYEHIRSESRCGICISETESLQLDALFSPLLRQGQSIHHICVTQPAEVMFSEKTIYNYVDRGIFSAKNIDLPRKVRFRKRKSRHDSFKVDKSCRIGRTYKDYLAFLSGRPDCPVVQMDSVVGKQSGKVLLTIHFVKTEFMLAFLRERNTAASVFHVLETLYQVLGADTFMELFPVLLADNGSEFSDPVSIETSADNQMRTRMFYCDPSAPYQKGAAENNHEFIRRILPKGTSFDEVTQGQITQMMNHINSYHRKNLGDHSPYEMFRLFYGQNVLDTLGAELIPPNEITLRPALLK